MKKKRAQSFMDGAGERGASALETAITLPVLIAIIFSTISLVHFGYEVMALRHSLESGARFAAVGKNLPDLTREESIVETIQTRGESLGLEMQPSGIHICPVDLECEENYAGAPGANVAISVEQPLKVLFLNTTVNMSMSVEVKSEEFPWEL